MSLEKRSRFMSDEKHRFLYEYFLFLEDNILNHFAERWNQIRNFDPFFTNRISLIPFLIARGMPDHLSGSAQQRQAMRHLKENFSIWEDKAISAIHNMDAGNLLIMVQGIANLNASPSERFMAKWLQQLKHSMNRQDSNLELSRKDKTLGILSLGLLQSQNPDIDFKPCYLELRKHINDAGLISDDHTKQVYDADIYFTNHSDLTNPSQKEKKSASEYDLKAMFKAAGFEVYSSKECPIPKLNNAIDFTVEDSKGRKVHIEFDGPTHFFNPKAKNFLNLKYDLSSRFRSALMVKLAPWATIARVDFRTFGIITAKGNEDGSISETQKTFCRAIFAKAIANGAGCYHVDLGNKALLTDMILKKRDAKDSSISSLTPPAHIIAAKEINGVGLT